MFIYFQSMLCEQANKLILSQMNVLESLLHAKDYVRCFL